MKKVFLTALAASAIAMSASAQGTYLRVGTGYAFGTASGTTSESTANSVTSVHYSYGKGINNQVGLGFMFSEHVGAELAVGYLLGGKTTTEDTGENYSYTYETKANMLSFMPSIVLTAGSDGVNPYARFGLIAGMVKGTTTEDENDDDFKTSVTIEEKGGISLGLNAALGVQFPLSDNLGFYVEANLMQLAWAPKEGEITEATADGENVLGDIDDKTWTYEKDITFSSTGGFPEGKQLQEKRPMSNAGVGLGIVFKF